MGLEFFVLSQKGYRLGFVEDFFSVKDEFVTAAEQSGCNYRILDVDET